MYSLRFFTKLVLFISPRQRGSATGLVISGYGLSAFLFSTISHTLFAGSASSLLLLLSLGSSFPMILGFFFVRPVPLPEEEPNCDVYSETISSASAYDLHNSSHTPLLNNINGQDDDDSQIGVELSSSMRSQNSETPTHRRNISRSTAMALDILPNLHGKKLWCSSDFWLLFGILSIRTFTCLSAIIVHL